MYIKVKNPERYALLILIVTMTTLVVILLAITGILIVIAGDTTLVWQQARQVFESIKEDKGILLAWVCVLAIGMIPVGLVSTIIQWYQKRRIWNRTDAIYALDFTPDGVTVYTRQGTQFLPYGETHLSVKGELITVRTKNSSHAALNALALTFKQDKNSFTVRHKPTLAFLYRLADLHPYFKKLSFEFTPSSHYDTDQRELANFLREQIENQRRFGLHRRYRGYFILTLCGILFMALGTGALWMTFTTFDPYMFMMWVLMLLGLGMLSGGISLICGVLQDSAVARKIKQLRATRSN